MNAEVFGVSTDSVNSHDAWIHGDLGKINYPLLSDMTKKVTEDYGVLVPAGKALRGTFIINPDGEIAWLTVSDNDRGRSVTEILRSLAALQTNAECPVDWQPGDKTL